MASTDTLFILTPMAGIAPATNYATLDTITETSTPNAIIPVLDFDGGADEHMDWHVTVPSHYDGNGFDFSVKWASGGTQSGDVEFEFRVIKLASSDDLSSDLSIDLQTAVGVTDTPIATLDEFNISAEFSLSHANADSPAVGDRLIIRCTRDFDHATNTDDAQLVEVLVTET